MEKQEKCNLDALKENILYVAIGLGFWYISSIVGIVGKSTESLLNFVLVVVFFGNIFTRNTIEKELYELKHKDIREINLEKELDKFFYNFGKPNHLQTEKEQEEYCKNIANHFYEIGCNNVSVMHDDIGKSEKTKSTE